MAKAEREIRLVETERARPAEAAEGSMKGLLRQLGTDVSTLVQQEMALAKLEMRQAATALTSDLVKIGMAVGLAAVGGLALVAAAILVLGELLGDAYWASALIVGVLFLLIGGVLAMSGIRDLKRQHLKPEDTIETLREDARFAKAEAREFKREVTS